VGSIYDWSTTASDNGNSDATVNYAEGQTPASLNNSARAAMARVAAWLKSLGAAITHGGSSNAYTLTLPTGHQITAYATGMRFLWKPNGNSSGSVTLNVDGVGAKKVFLPSGSQAGSGHITSGTLLDVVYDATLDSSAGGFQIVGSSSALTAQPLDATLTALAALSWSSGNALVQFTAADTVSLTLAPSVTSVTASNGSAATTPAATFTNTADNANVMALRIEGDRATPTTNDIVYASWFLSDAAGNQEEFGRISCQGWDLTNGSEDSFLIFHYRSSGSMVQAVRLGATVFQPTSNDGIALGAAAQAFSDLYLATGANVGFGNGDVTLTHSSDTLTLTGGGLVSPSKRSTETGGTLTSASSNRIVVLATAPTIDGNVHAADDQILLVNNTASSMTITAGSTGSPTQRLSGTTTTGNRTLAARGKAHVYFISATEWSISGDVS
jgi:hypothetical protein